MAAHASHTAFLSSLISLSTPSSFMPSPLCRCWTCLYDQLLACPSPPPNPGLQGSVTQPPRPTLPPAGVVGFSHIDVATVNCLMANILANCGDMSTAVTQQQWAVRLLERLCGVDSEEAGTAAFFVFVDVALGV